MHQRFVITRHAMGTVYQAATRPTRPHRPRTICRTIADCTLSTVTVVLPRGCRACKQVHGVWWSTHGHHALDHPAGDPFNGRCLACRNRMVPGPASLIVFQQGKTLPPCDEWLWKSARQQRFWPHHSGRAGNRSSETGSCQKVMEIIVSRCHQNRIDLSCLPFLRIRLLLQRCGR